MNKVAVGIDIGGTNTVFGIITRDGKIVADGSIKTREFDEIEVFVAALYEKIQVTLGRVGNNHNVMGYGIGAPMGNINKGTMEYPAGLPWKGIIHLADHFRKHTPLPAPPSPRLRRAGSPSKGEGKLKETSVEKNKGFTLIEVMFSLIVFMVAVMGLVALQRVSLEGAERGRQHTAAVNVASFFLTQLQSEIATWGEHVSVTSFPSDRFPMLTGAIGGATTLPATWFELNSNNSLRVDEFLGHSSLDDGNASSRFCVNYMISCLESPLDESQNPIPCQTNIDEVTVWKVRVRVSWPKKLQFESGGGGTNPWTSCAPDDVNLRVDQTHTDDAVELVAVATRELAL